MELTAHLLCHIWKARKNWIFNSVTQEGYMVVQHAIEDWFEFKKANHSHTSAERYVQQDDQQEMEYLKDMKKQHEVII